jgi:hypothetical protein
VTIEPIHIWQAGFAILAAYAFAGLFKQFFGADATIRNPRIVRQPATVSQPVTGASEVSEADYAAALLVIRKRLEQQMHAELQRVISTGPVS